MIPNKLVILTNVNGLICQDKKYQNKLIKSSTTNYL